MIKPQRLKPNDKVAIVSLSRGMLGENKFIHILEIAKRRLEEYGLEVIVMSNALKGIKYLYKHPEARAKDLMNAFKDKSIKAIINAIGGDDTIRLLPYIDFEVIRNNPKIFMGFSDTTVNHLMMYKAGLVSYYGGSLMNNWGEYVEINEYTKNALENAFFNPLDKYEIKSSPYCSYEDKKVYFDINNVNIKRETEEETKGYEVLQGKSKVKGQLLGGCAETFVYLMGTSLWPTLNEWKDKILFIEVSDEEKSELPEYYFAWILRNLEAQGIFNVINGIIMGKPPVKEKYDAYKEILFDIVNTDGKHYDLPIIYNVNFGHAYPIGIIPIGLECELDLDNKKIIINEKFTE